MKFADRPDYMTPGQEKWLRQLLDGPKSIGRYGAYPRSACLRKGWTRWYWATTNYGVEISDAEAIQTPIEKRVVMAAITDAGREALQNLGRGQK